MTSIYLAARYGRRDELSGYAAQLLAAGHEITSRWLSVHRPGISEFDLLEKPEFRALAAEIAMENIADLEQAQLSIHFTESPRVLHPHGGRHVEFGIALTWRQQVIICGPRENLFHSVSEMAVQNFETWEDVRALLCDPAMPGRWRQVGNLRIVE